VPFDLATLERGFGECVAEFNGHDITLRYHATINNRALDAMYRATVGEEIVGGGGRFPNVGAIADELIKILLPLGHEYGDGWDLLNDGQSIPITKDAILDMPPALPGTMLGAIVRDVNDPNRRKPSRRSSSPGASSAPAASPTTSEFSMTPNGQASLPGPSLDETIQQGGPVGATGYAR
jgi:hypothetical protein